LEAGVCKPGNVCPERRGRFEYRDIVRDALMLERVCFKAMRGMPLGLLYAEALASQRSTLTGFVILSVPLMRHLDKGIKGIKEALEELKSTRAWEAREFLRALSSLGLSHFKRVEGAVDATRWREYQGNLWELFSELSKHDHLFKEIVLGYPLSVRGAKKLIKERFDPSSIRELQREVLAEIIDSLVARRHGYRVALELLKAAREGFHEWVIEKYSLNPGTAADIIAMSILLGLAEEGT